MLNQKGNIFISVLIGVLISGGLFGAYLYLSNNSSNKIALENTELKASLKPEQTNPPVQKPTNKKIYTNSQYGYSFEYPGDAVEVDDKSSSLPNVLYIQTKGYTFPTSQQEGSYKIEVNANKENVISLDDYINQKKGTPDESFIKSQVKSTINGNSVVVITYKSSADDLNIGNRDTQKQYYIYSGKLGVTLTGSGPLDGVNTDHTLLDNIVSSFKLLN